MKREDMQAACVRLPFKMREDDTAVTLMVSIGRVSSYLLHVLSAPDSEVRRARYSLSTQLITPVSQLRAKRFIVIRHDAEARPKNECKNAAAQTGRDDEDELSPMPWTAAAKKMN